MAVVAAGMCAFFNMYVTQALLPSLQRVFHAGIAELSLTITLTTLAVALTAPLAGSLSDRYGRKRVLLLSLAGLGLTTLLASTAPSLRWLLFWRLAEGMFIPGVFTSTVAYIGEEWPAAAAPAVTALYVSGTVFGSFCGRFLAGIITAHFGWPVAFAVLGAANLLFLPVIAYGLPVSSGFHPAASLRHSVQGLGRHLHNPRLLATYAIGFGILFSQVATFTYVNFHLAAPPFSLNLHQLSFIFCVFLIGMVITPLAGRLASRYGQRRLLLAATVIGSGGMLLTLRPLLADVVLGLTLSSAGVFIAQSMATSLVPTYAGAARSSAVGLYVMFYYFGGSVGAVLPSAMWSSAGWPGCVVLVILMQVGIAVIGWRTWQGVEPDANSPDAVACAARAN